jgi:poly(3-hydroxybutyrate) depolymerase
MLISTFHIRAATTLTLAMISSLALALAGCSPDDRTARPDAGGQPDAMRTDAPLAADGADSAPTADTGTPDATPRASTFAFVSRAPASCPRDASWCSAHWPTDGTVYLYTLTETRSSSGESYTREAYVYHPSRLKSAAPALIYLHGGTGNAERMLEKTSFSALADSRGSAGLTWRPNSADCQFKAKGIGYVKPAGGACLPPAVTMTNSQPFYLVLPQGLLDEGSTDARHWEDGRTPSPGFSGDSERRDDVGFINALIAELKAREDHVDASRIYLAGSSNGGQMTARAACNRHDPALPELRRVAAFGVLVANMAENIFKGIAGRERCAGAGPTALALGLFVGNGIDTPNCRPFGCKQPSVLGDGRVAYGVSGGFYLNNSPDGGRTTNLPDTLAHWLTYQQNSGFASAKLDSRAVGFFSSETTYPFVGTDGRVVLFEVDGGQHDLNGTRMDHNPSGKLWSFVSSFSRAANGELTYLGHGHVTNVDG